MSLLCRGKIFQSWFPFFFVIFGPIISECFFFLQIKRKTFRIIMFSSIANKRDIVISVESMRKNERKKCPETNSVTFFLLCKLLKYSKQLMEIHSWCKLFETYFGYDAIGNKLTLRYKFVSINIRISSIHKILLIGTDDYLNC